MSSLSLVFFSMVENSDGCTGFYCVSVRGNLHTLLQVRLELEWNLEFSSSWHKSYQNFSTGLLLARLAI